MNNGHIVPKPLSSVKLLEDDRSFLRCKVSQRNLQRMRKFAQLYLNLLIAPQAVAQWPCGHFSILIHKVKDESE